MKRVILLILLAFGTLLTIESFADSSPPGVEIKISYDQNDVNFENQSIVLEAIQEITFSRNIGELFDVHYLRLVTSAKDYQLYKRINKFAFIGKAAYYRQNYYSFLVKKIQKQ